MSKLNKKNTSRGFSLYEFRDRNGIECSLQKSSIATENCIWLGANELGIQEFVAYREPNAWEPRPEFDKHTMEHHFVANNIMHLSREQVAELLPVLQKFVETGEIG